MLVSLFLFAPPVQKAPIPVIVRTETAAFSLAAPTGWVLECRGNRPDGLAAVLRPVGTSWKSFPTTMSASVFPKRDLSLEALAGTDRGNYLDGEPKRDVASVPDLRNAAGAHVIVTDFDDDGTKTYHRRAYLELPKRFVNLVLTAKTRAGRTRAVPAFAALVRSFRPIR